MAVPLFQLALHQIPQVPVDDGLMMIFNDHQLFLPFVALLFVGQVVRGNALLLNQVADILFVLESSDNVTVGPFGVAVIGGVPRLPQLPGNDGSPLLFDAVLLENQPNQLGPLGIDGHLSVLDIVAQ